MRQARVIVGLLLVAVLVASACGRATPTPPPTPPPTAGTPAPATPSPQATPIPVAKPTGELRIALGYVGVEIVDPILAPASGKPIFELPYDWLVGSTPDSKLSAETGLTEKWEISSDLKTYTFRLRKGIKFHNGDEVTAEDVKYSIERVMSPRSVTSYAGTFRSYVASMETPDRYTLVIRTKEPYGFLHWDVSGVLGQEGIVLPKKYIQEIGEDNFALRPVGTGPYKFKEQVIGSYLKLEALDSHWREGVPRFKTVTYFLVPEETTRVALLKTGGADIIDISRERAAEMKGFSTFLKEGGDVVGVKIHNLWEKDSPFYDKRVRQALNLAINKEDIVKFLFAGQAKVSGVFPAGSYSLGYQAMPPYPFDPEKAKQLLAEAGYAKGFEVTLWSFARAVSEGPKLTEAVASYLEKVGLKTKIIASEYGTYRSKWSRGEFSRTLGWHDIANRPMAHGLFRIILHSTALLALAKDPEVDKLIEAIEKSPTTEEYAKGTTAFMKYIHENYLTIPILETGALYATNQKITGWDVGKIMYGLNSLALVRR